MIPQPVSDLTQWESLNEALINCRLCPRLTAWREEMAAVKRRAYRDEIYWGKPVPGFGDRQARLLVVGLAPGAHGSNRTGRMFTGDSSGDFLYSALHKVGFANQPKATGRDDGLQLKDVFITAVGRCAPPDNKPEASELSTCRPYLLAEMALLKQMQGVVALGKIAFDAMVSILREQGANLGSPVFGHGAFVQDDHYPWLLGSYHPSRQNTQTGRLTPAMFDEIWLKAANLLKN